MVRNLSCPAVSQICSCEKTYVKCSSSNLGLCVAYLHLFALDFNGFHWEIHANSVPVSLHIVASLKALQYGCFPRATVSDKDDFEQEVEILLIGQSHQRLWITRRHFLRLSVQSSLLPRLLLGLCVQLVIVLHGKYWILCFNWLISMEMRCTKAVLMCPGQTIAAGILLSIYSLNWTCE